MIIRRKLFTYTVIFTAGISAGFFIFEKTRLAEGFLVMASAGLVICLAAGKDTAQMKKLIAWLAAGFLLFACRYVYYGTGIQAQPDTDIDTNELEVTPGSDTDVLDVTTGSDTDELDFTTEVTTIEGFAHSVSVEDDRIKIVLQDTDAARTGLSVLVNLYKADGYDPADLIGRRVRAYGKLKDPPGADNPGCFDYRIYLRSKGIGYLFTAKAVDLCDDVRAKFSMRGRYRLALYLARERFLDLFDDPEVRAFIKGTVFGDKSDIDEDTIDDFTQNGTGHMLAVSGLHAGFLYALMRLITGRKRSLVATLLTVGVLFLYGEMTLWSPSAMRAVTVLSVSMMSVYVRRPFDLLSSVSAAALLILMREPYQLFSTGFQLSFAALLGICFLARPLTVFIGEWFAVPIAVQAAVLPLTAYVFHRINLLSVFINIPVIFMASVLVPVCMSTLMISMMGGTVPHVVIYVIEGLSGVILRFNEIAASGGTFSSLVTAGTTGLIILFYLVSFLVASEWFRVRLLRKEYRTAAVSLACALVLSCCFGLAAYNTFADDEIVFVSVGQGDCTHIRAGGKDVLIDGGGDIERNIAKDTLMPYLLSNGAERAEIGLVTHLHTDHYLGLVQLSYIYPVGAVGIPAEYRRAVERQLAMRGTEEPADYVPDEQGRQRIKKNDGGYLLPENIEYVEQGSKIMVTDDVYIEPIWPPRGSRGDVEIDDPNENNMVFIVNYRGVKVMVTGDMLEEDELEMIKYYRGTDILDCDVLKVAHHGSKSSSSEEFLDAVSPEIAVIQVGVNNFYGHPHQQTLDRLEARGIRVYRTDLNGAVGIDIKRNRLIVDLMRCNDMMRMSP